MKLVIDGQQYEVSNECANGLLSLLKIMVDRMELPKEVKSAFGAVNELSKDEIIIFSRQLEGHGMHFYHSLSTRKRITAIALARGLITHMATKFGTSVARVIVPPRRVDPIEHLVSVFYPVIENKIIPDIAGVLDDATIEVITKGNTVTSIVISQDSSRRAMDIDGDFREWEDYSGKNAR